MCQELVHHTSTTNMVDYIGEEPTPIDTTPIDTTSIDTTSIDNTANPADGIDAVSLYPDTLANPQDDIDPIAPIVDVKLRKGEYIIKIAKTNTDAINFEQVLDSALKKIVFNAFRRDTKPKRRRTVAEMTPEQIEKARQHRLNWYRKNKDKVRIYAKGKYNNDYDYWKKTTDYQRERYRASRANIEKQKPGPKPRSRSSSNDENASHSPQPMARSRGRPRTRPILETKERRPPGRPVTAKFFAV